MEKLTAIIAKIDLGSDGTSQRWTIGKPGGAVSGAIYLPKNVKLPCEITIGFLAGSAQHEKNKEEGE
jgi:hypothetical protein